jgi:DnaJ-class molecular chaperone
MAKCNTCDDGAVKCPKCHGKGRVEKLPFGGYKDCDHCNGSGQKKCGVCNGTGKI